MLLARRLHMGGAVVVKPTAPSMTIVDPDAISYAQHRQMVDEVTRLKGQLEALRFELKSERGSKDLSQRLVSRVLKAT